VFAIPKYDHDESGAQVEYVDGDLINIMLIFSVTFTARRAFDFTEVNGSKKCGVAGNWTPRSQELFLNSSESLVFKGGETGTAIANNRSKDGLVHFIKKQINRAAYAGGEIKCNKSKVTGERDVTDLVFK
jgi:hypothetical protein